MFKLERFTLISKKDYFFCIGKRIFILVGTCSTIQQLLTGLFSELIKKIDFFANNNSMYIMLYLVMLIASIAIIIYTTHEYLQTEFIVKIKHENQENKIIIKIDNYEDNMEGILNKIKNTDKHAVFVIGINDKIEMSIAERKGVHKSVLDKFYSDEKECAMLQEKVNRAFNKIQNFKGNFGDIGMVKHNENSNILFVINSKYESETSTSIIGPQPTDIIGQVFKYLEKEKIEIVQFPILSSTNVKCSNNSIKYSVTIAEIIEEYFKEILNPNNIDYDLVLSIRQEDLKNKSIRINDIVNFIKNIKEMYHIK